MKPIALTISGLHSFREKQTVDFSSLCEGGVFGIFGPTGSGKSSILDAMTLALYGKVERAANNTHGIINHAEDTVHVSFTFELENAESLKRYSVERMFKRTDEHRVKTALCRILEHGEETAVLADKAAEVNEKVHALLGLTIDDFTRAVVLPQGKFAEFLSLKGAERRQMLQRLFHLEQYGEELVKKVRKRLTDARGEQNEISAEQAGLGDASKEAVKFAEEELKGVNLLLEKRQKEYEETVRHHQELEEVRALQLEQESYEKELAELEKKKADIQQLAAKLDRAEKADLAKPYAEALQTAEREKEGSRRIKEESVAEWQRQKQSYASAAAAYEEIRKQKAAEEPALASRKEQLLQLLALEEELQHEIRLLEEKAAQNKRLTTELTEKEESAARANELLKKAVQKQNLLKEQMEQNTVTSKERERIRAASEQRMFLTNAESVVTEWKNKTEQKKQKILQSDETIMQAKKKMHEYEDSMKALYENVQKGYHASCEVLNQHKKHAETRRQLLQEEKKNVQRNMAEMLAKSLTTDEPCPVCGSVHHPAPADFKALESSDGSNLEMLEKQADKDALLTLQLENAKEKWEDLSKEMILSYSFLSSVLTELEDGNDEMDVLTESKSLTQDFLQMKEQYTKLHSTVRKQNEALRQLEFTHGSHVAEHKEAAEKWQQTEKEYNAALEKWTKAFGDLTADQAAEEQRLIREKDEQFEELKTRVAKSIDFIEEKEKEIKQLETECQQLSISRAELTAYLTSMRQTAGEKQKRIEKETGDKHLSLQLRENEAMQKELYAKEQSLYKSFQEAMEAVQKAESSSAAAEKTFEQAEARLRDAAEKWEQIKQQTPFKDAAEAASAFMPQAIKQSLKEEFDVYQDKKKQVMADFKRVEAKRKNRSVSLDEWESIKELKAETKQLADAASEARGAAAKALHILKDKHERYMELEQKRLELEELAARLEKLQTVFKGNAFVEFLAEEQLHLVSEDASERLGQLTRQRYAIEVDSSGGFVMRDDANGGVRRPVSSLSGGETFLTSLALALSLSSQIQLRGEYPLQFFFLDEGFGTLDADLLDTVITALEKLQSNNLSVGVISHVQELRARLPRKLVVTPAEPTGSGTSVQLELM
ncbi:SbcC/MukB-like Walker B domain-containing protein [Metabacillus indicus]|uniref:Nuclease SbcCD subunit C n=1 Tax=Metabacillus indicus TaxID=246786 RepID=A0A084GJB2_METID|nr:SbcC/MukB-like Walker B domain-containing protein [Metabacillus indicus]KEZ47424.1 hypothetical protein GS18_0221635 [Metabacillus indicus]